MAILTVADFGNPLVNGIFTSDGSKDGQLRYVKNNNANIIIEYREEYGPYCFSGAYYILIIHQIEGAIPITKPLYKIDSDDPTGLTWVTMQSQTEGPVWNTVGTVS
jgi:hypothetical protein